jgi:hypothetical protein
MFAISGVAVRGARDLTTTLVGALARTATSTAGALGGAAVGGGLGALGGATSGAVRGSVHGAIRGRRSTPAAMATAAALGVAGVVDWPVLLGAGGTTLVLDKTLHPRPTAVPTDPDATGPKNGTAR